MARDPEKYRIDGRRAPSVTEILTLSGWSDLSHIPPQVLAWAAARGQYVHDATELIDAGTFDWTTAARQNLGYLKSYVLFMEDEKPEIVASEEVVKHPELFYAGQLDRRWRWRRDLWVVDIKTGKDPQVSWRLQTAAYALPQEKPHRRGSLRLCKDGSKAKFVEYDDPDDLRLFAAAAVTVNAQIRAGLLKPKWLTEQAAPEQEAQWTEF